MNNTLDSAYLECDLPKWLVESIQRFVNGKNSNLWDCYYCELQSDINVCEVEGIITEEQAWYLRGKYLDIERQ